MRSNIQIGLVFEPFVDAKLPIPTSEKENTELAMVGGGVLGIKNGKNLYTGVFSVLNESATIFRANFRHYSNNFFKT